MSSTLYLTVDEQKHVWPKLPTALQGAWKKNVKTEEGTAFETADELLAKWQALEVTDPKPLHTMLERAAESEADGFSSLPSGDLSLLLHAFGASGLSAIIEATLQEEGLSDRDFAGLAFLSAIRRDLLKENASRS